MPSVYKWETTPTSRLVITTELTSLANIAIAQDNTNDRATWNADDVVWASSTITAAGAVLYRSRGGASSADELVKYFDFGGNKSSSNAPFTVEFDSAGIMDGKDAP